MPSPTSPNSLRSSRGLDSLSVFANKAARSQRRVGFTTDDWQFVAPALFEIDGQTGQLVRIHREVLATVAVLILITRSVISFAARPDRFEPAQHALPCCGHVE